MADFNFDFMNNPSFGALGGASEAASTRLNQLKAQEVQGAIAEQPARTRLLSAQAYLEESKATEARFISSIMGSGAAPGRSPSSSGSGQSAAAPSLSMQMLGLADRLEVGAPMKAMEVREKAAAVAAHESAAAHSRTMQMNEQEKGEFARWDKLGAAGLALKNADPAQAQAQYEATLLQLAQDPQMVPVLKQMPALYSDAGPKLDAFIATSEKTKDILAEKAKTRAQDEKERQDRARDVLWTSMIERGNQREARADAREARLEKTGGKPIGQPTTAELRAAEQSIYQNFLPDYQAPDGKVLTKEQQAIAKQVTLGARENAYLARKASREQNISYDTALAQVVSKQAQDKDWKFVAGVSHLISPNEPAQLTHAGGASRETAVAAPAPADRIKGHYYVKNGQVGRWDGKGLLVEQE